MYQIEDKQSAISEVQRMLHLNQTGVFDKKTFNAVAELQNRNNIEVTGVVDYNTFLLILSDYKATEASKIQDGFVSNFPYTKGSQGSDIEHINSLLRNVISEYNIDLKSPFGGYFGIDTELAVKALQKIFTLPENDEISAELYNRLLKENIAIKIKKRFK